MSLSITSVAGPAVAVAASLLNDEGHTRGAQPENATFGPVLGCRLLGHRFRFSSQGATMIWRCERCGEGGSKEYADEHDAALYARAFDRDGSSSLGRRAPLIGLLPLRLWRSWRDSRSRP
jgi:hypothetical protein